MSNIAGDESSNGSVANGEDGRLHAVDMESRQGMRRDIDYEPIADGTISNISQEQTHAQEEDAMQVDQQEDADKKLLHQAKKYLAQQTHEVIIPSYSAWFSFDSIHDVEKKALPEFFSGRNRSKTPSVYKDYRDFMIHTYRLNPTEYLTVTACRRNLAGDVCAIIRVHAFLEQWGLINYQVSLFSFIHSFISFSFLSFQIDPDSRPTLVGPQYTGHFRLTADTPKGLQPFTPAAPSAVPTAGGAATAVEAVPAQKAAASHLSHRQNVYQSSALSDKARAAALSQTRVSCGTCSADCTSVRYHCVKTKDLDICPLCFMEGRFSSLLNSGDFVKVTAANLHRGDEETWSDEEMLLLLEGIEMFDEDWNAVSQHVGTRSREQCVLKFLQLPIEDEFLESDPNAIGPLKYHNIPFSQADNPVMSVIAFLASVVNPGVASAAAKAALKELASISWSKQDQSHSPSRSRSPSPKRLEMTTAAHETSKSVSAGLEKAASAALGAAAAKAKVIADFEEREIQRLVNAAIEAQMKKVELKMQQFEELESILEKERQDLERQRQQLFVDRISLQKAILSVSKGGSGQIVPMKMVSNQADETSTLESADIASEDAVMTSL